MKCILIFFLFLLLNGCLNLKNTDSRHQVITISNRSDKNIYFYRGTCEGEIMYEDPYGTPLFYVKSGATEGSENDNFENYIERCYLKRVTYNFFDAEVLATTPWDTVFHRKMILGSKSYTKAQLDSLGWRIEFP